jgi:hypothetical protein
MNADGSDVGQALSPVTDPFTEVLGDVRWTPGGKIAYFVTTSEA